MITSKTDFRRFFRPKTGQIDFFDFFIEKSAFENPPDRFLGATPRPDPILPPYPSPYYGFVWPNVALNSSRLRPPRTFIKPPKDASMSEIYELLGFERKKFAFVTVRRPDFLTF